MANALSRLKPSLFKQHHGWLEVGRGQILNFNSKGSNFRARMFVQKMPTWGTVQGTILLVVYNLQIRMIEGTGTWYQVARRKCTPYSEVRSSK